MDKMVFQENGKEVLLKSFITLMYCKIFDKEETRMMHVYGRAIGLTAVFFIIYVITSNINNLSSDSFLSSAFYVFCGAMLASSAIYITEHYLYLKKKMTAAFILLFVFLISAATVWYNVDMMKKLSRDSIGTYNDTISTSENEIEKNHGHLH